MRLKNNRFICQTILIINLLFCSSIIFAQEGTEILNGFSMKHDVYKILTLEEWNTAKKNGKVITELDQNDGFVHLSTSNQLGLTLSLYFKDHKNVVLLLIVFSLYLLFFLTSTIHMVEYLCETKKNVLVV